MSAKPEESKADQAAILIALDALGAGEFAFEHIKSESGVPTDVRTSEALLELERRGFVVYDPAVSAEVTKRGLEAARIYGANFDRELRGDRDDVI